MEIKGDQGKMTKIGIWMSTLRKLLPVVTFLALNASAGIALGTEVNWDTSDLVVAQDRVTTLPSTAAVASTGEVAGGQTFVESIEIASSNADLSTPVWLGSLFLIFLLAAVNTRKRRVTRTHFAPGERG